MIEDLGRGSGNGERAEAVVVGKGMDGDIVFHLDQDLNRIRSKEREIVRRGDRKREKAREREIRRAVRAPELAEGEERRSDGGSAPEVARCESARPAAKGGGGDRARRTEVGSRSGGRARGDDDIAIPATLQRRREIGGETRRSARAGQCEDAADWHGANDSVPRRAAVWRASCGSRTSGSRADASAPASRDSGEGRRYASARQPPASGSALSTCRMRDFVDIATTRWR
ncbi:hypothetical protein Scep_026303 [Stephania cephalantha]|uniref:Uncharacterized protein n=1 Tax=Stephania cephalantha TaxID=152367 RepID=A0AAP0EKA4_9MAGN